MGRNSFWRNVWCSKYSGCLYRAAKDNQNFDCSRCSFRADEGEKDKISNVFKEAILLIAVFKPEVYRLLKSSASDFHFMLCDRPASAFVRRVHGALRGYDDASLEDHDLE